MRNFEIVAKFGGSSVAQPQHVKRHESFDDPDVVVVSAPGVDIERGYYIKATDILLTIKDGSDRFKDLRQRFEYLAEDMELPNEAIERRGIKFFEQDIREWQDKNWPIEALGEYWTARMYAAYLGRRFVDAAEIIRFDLNGQLDLEQSSLLIKERLMPGDIVPGYYGADYDGNIRVFVRGGSDITPAIICRAKDAKEYHNWSDVDGFMTTDPAKNPNALMFNALEYPDVIDMANNGCQLLHPEVCKILGDSEVKTVMRNTFGELGNRGTEIVGSSTTMQEVAERLTLRTILV